jgi:hypothetical protein
MDPGGTMKRLLAVVLAVAACTGATPASDSPAPMTIEQVAGAYLGIATTANDAMDDASRLMSGSPEEIKAYCATRVDIERAFLAGLDGIAFPTGLDERVAALRTLETAFIDAVTSCAEADLSDVTGISGGEPLAEASRATRRAAMLLRADLGLPTTEEDSLGFFH